MRLTVIPFYILSLFFFPNVLSAQVFCGCAGQANCPIVAPASEPTQVCYEISDAFNGLLSNPNQGVCGVSITFRHGNIGQQELTLCSPDGTCIQLTGDACAGSFTPLSTWDVLFVPCDSVPEPDENYPPQWENCPNTVPFTTPWGNALYSGSYHPFSGCLEDFNSGPANGQWCITMDNSSPFNSGQILDFEVILCDESGLLCCEADAGSLALFSDLEACEGDSSLIFDVSPQYGATEPDTSEYGYFFVLSENGEIIEYQEDSINMIDYPPGVYEVCGLSFSYADELLIPAPNTGVDFATLAALLSGASPPFCGDAESGCLTVTISEPVPPVDIEETICEGDTVWIATEPFTETGDYAVILTAENNCDSLVNLDLTVLEADTVYLEETICFGDSILVGDSTYFETGIYETILESFNGCDSTVNLTLTKLDTISTILDETICEGDTVWVGTNFYTETGNFSDTLPSFEFQCDSIIYLDLTVISVVAEILEPDTLNCSQQSLILNGTNSTIGLDYDYQWSTDDGHFTTDTDGIFVTIDSAGTYFLTVSNGNCVEMDTVIVTEDFNQPMAAATVTNDINCLINTTALDGSNSMPSAGNELNYFWSSATGCPISNPNEAIINVSCTDIFTLIIENNNNLCRDTTTVEVFGDLEQPIADAGADAVLNCIDTCIDLNANNSQPLNDITFSWSTIDGNIKTGENSANPQIDSGGEYQLIVENQINFCRDTDFVQINYDTLSPNIEFILNNPDTLTCLDTIINLMANDLNGGLNLNYNWTGIETGQGTPSVTVENSGFINLILTNSNNGCFDEDSIFIAENIELPIADAGDADTLTLTCVDESLQLGTNNTSTGSEFSYSWTTDIGHFITLQNIPQPLADSVGIYYLTVTNNLTGCIAMDSVVLDSNYHRPIAEIGPDGQIDCLNPDHTFTAAIGNEFWFYEWFLNGQPLDNGINLNEITVADTGMVTLIVTGQPPLACSVFDTAFVISTAEPPFVDAGEDVFLDCETGEAMLNGNAGLTANIIFNWDIPSGCFLENNETLTPTANCIGDYILEVTDIVTNCVASDTVSVFIDTTACLPMVFAGIDGTLDCDSTIAFVEADASMGAIYEYEWTTCDGSDLPAEAVIDDVFNPQFPAGCYIFTVTNTVLNLSAADTLNLIDGKVFPTAEAGAANIELTCPELETCYQIDASGTSQGIQFSYSWQSLNGQFCSDTTVLNPEVVGEGAYILTVTNINNGCTASDAVIISKLGESPIADAGDPVLLECGIAFDTLDASNSDLPPNAEICWFSNTGTILSGKNTLFPIVEGTGIDDTFSIVITNPINLCTDTAFTMLQEPDCFPVCEILFPEVLTCDLDTVCLEASQNTISDENCYEWTTLFGGNIVSEDTLSKIQVTAAGFYELAVMRKVNGAQFTTTCQVQVTENITPPDADAGDNQFLSCIDSCVTLDASQSSPNATYLWSTFNGNIKSGATTLQAEVNQMGDYTLTVTSLQNGCTATDQVMVGEDFDTPIVDAGGDQTISCAGTVSLFGSSMPSSNAEVTILWTTIDGNILAGENSLSPIVASIGTYCMEVTDISSGCVAEDCVEVTEDNLTITCDILNEDTLYLNCLNTDFQLVATAETQPGSIITNTFWSSENDCLNGNVNGLTLNVDCADTYVFTAIDNNGCLCTRSVLVLEDNLPPIADAGEDIELNCENPTIDLNGNNSSSQSIHPNAGNLIYNWTTDIGEFKTDQDIPNPTICAGGNYFLEIIDPISNCTASDTVLVTELFQLPVINIMGDTTLTCSRDTANLSGDGSSTGIPFTHCWTTSDGNILGDNCDLNITANLPAFYILTVIDTSTNCEVSDSIFVQMDTLSPIADIDNSEILTVTCGIPTVSLDGSNSSPTDSLIYNWTTVNGNIVSPTIGEMITVDSGGIYTLEVTHLRNGCTDEMSFEILEDFEQPIVNLATPETLTCAIPEVQLEAFPPTNEDIYDYEWSAAAGAICNGENTATPTVKASVTYTVTITNQQNGCTNQNSLFVNQDVVPPIAEASVNGTLDCIQTTAEISGVGSTTTDVSYLWTTTSGGIIQNPNNLTTEVNAAGFYFIEVMNNGNGCADTASVEVIATAVPILDVQVTVTQPNCFNNKGSIEIDTVIGGTPPFLYSLNNSVFNSFPLFQFLEVGIYDLTIEDVSGCTWNLEIILEEPTEVTVDLGPDLELTLGDSIILEAIISVPLSEIDTIIWEPFPLPNPDCPMCLEQSVFPLETTTYSVKVITNDGCTDKDQILVLVDERPHLFAPNIFSPNGDGNNDIFYLQADETILQINDLQVFDRWGNMVFHETEFLPNDPKMGWDGLFMGGMMNPQVFVWKAEILFRDGRVQVVYGDFVLNR